MGFANEAVNLPALLRRANHALAAALQLPLILSLRHLLPAPAAQLEKLVC